MSSLPANASTLDIEEEIMYQQALLSSLDSTSHDYEERSSEINTQLGLLEERLSKANEFSIDNSDSSISFDSASTSMTTPSQASSRSSTLSKRPLPSNFLSEERPAKRPSPSPIARQERMKIMQEQAEAQWRARKAQRDADAIVARALDMQRDAPGNASTSSSRPAWQATLQNNGSVNNTARPIHSQAHTLPVFPHAVASQPSLPRWPAENMDDFVDLTADEPPSRSLLHDHPHSTRPTGNSHSHLPLTQPHNSYTSTPSYAGPRIINPQLHVLHNRAGPSTAYGTAPSRQVPWQNPFQQFGSFATDTMQQLRDLVNTTNNRKQPLWSGGDAYLDDDDDDDDDVPVYLGQGNRMPGQYNPYAGREDLYRSRFEELESYNPEKTKEEINALLNNIRPDEELPDHLLIQTPEAMSVKLHKYQELGLTWLKKCEEGSNRGGILADDMGLGKTIQMLSLIVSHKPDDPRCKTTLIVAPVALLRQWKQEIEQKIKRRFALTVHIHHQTSKKAHFRDLAVYDIVLTTFGSLATEMRRMDKYLLRRKEDFHAKPRADERCVLIGEDSQWFRVILDEAQCIKNKQTQTARAACMVNAKYRFCMTGTPMMNNVDELFSLVKFLRIKPYDRWEKFRSDISQPIKGSMEDFRDNAMQRLQALCKAVMLRRTKKSTYRGQPILILPERTTTVDHAIFDEDEQSLYTALEQKTQVTFNKYLAAGTVGRSYSAILVLLLRLRQACCHPFLIRDLSIAAAADMSADDLLELARQLSDQAVARLKETNGNFECPICMDAVINPAIFLPCGHDTCRECYIKLADTSAGIAQGHENGVKARCPHCRGDIDPKKITDFTSFKRVYMPELLTREEKEQFNIIEEVEHKEDAERDALNATTESETEDGEETQSEEEGSDLDGFIVDDEDSETEMRSKKDGKKKMTEEKPKRRKSKKKSKKKAVLIEKPEKLLTFANLKANARGKKKAILLDKLRDSYTDSAKIRQLLALLDEVTTQDDTEKILVFSQWTSLLDLIEIALQPKGLDYRRYDGSMNATERADAVDDFKDNNKDVRLMLVSLKAGNAGLNLNVASRVIILDPFWNPYIEEQAIDRAHRIGQTRPVKVHRILIENTVEDRIITLQENKRRLIETALDEQSAAQLSRLGPRELAYLFGVSRNIGDPVPAAR